MFDERRVCFILTHGVYIGPPLISCRLFRRVKRSGMDLNSRVFFILATKCLDIEFVYIVYMYVMYLSENRSDL